ncbi:GILT-like protein 1 [Macrosteles quadrilineatus]|uniref:GILT-like protein 1 n=1 Tax=Macrosteles quadrilineatus TaxID=74068 RepID=UPI0023E2170B|nr:GILT-like protein 1 [Macrosteles quadrilineatus]
MTAQGRTEVALHAARSHSTDSFQPQPLTDMDLLAVLSLLAVVVASFAQKQCDLAVLFESHCPDSRNFIHQRLVPLWHKLEPHCTLDLVPFGKARSTEDGFVCQHGEKECRGNMVLSCALARLSPGRQQLDFASCFMGDPDFGGQDCATKSGLNWEDVQGCMSSEEGNRLQLEAETKSYSIRMSRFVPTVMINKNYKHSDQNQAIRGDFGDLMCQYVDSTELCS